MIHAITLALFIVLVINDALIDRHTVPLIEGIPPAAVLLCSTLPFAALWLVVHAILHRAGRALDRTGSARSLRRALRALAAARLATLALFATSVLACGWLALIRAAIGDLVLVDEVLALLPPVLTLILLWWSYYPIERRLREASVLTALDGNQVVPGLPTRFQYVLDQARLHLLLVLVPLFALTVWWESLDRALHWADRRHLIPPPGGWFDYALQGLQFLGVIIILAGMPTVLVHAWSTVKLGAGPLRDRLEALCRANRVRVRDLLVWRTHNAMVNGALIGLIPPFRYILLTDALLASLPMRQVEAVMAHEVAHARRHHLPWLVVILMATAGATWTCGTYALTLLFPSIPDDSLLPGTALTILTLTITFLMFGHTSRRFEQQADTFAVQHLSREDTPDAEAPPVTEAAADAMAGALANVAILNHIDPIAFSYRHGSIQTRRRRLRALVSRPVDSLEIDRRVRRLKTIALAVLAVLILLTIFDPFA